jgi:hypothetical protein
MTASSDLMLAILSMDAYDQGYGAGIGGVGTKIGNATFLEDSDTVLPAGADQSAGFYAAAYTLTTGQTVIAYRGTTPASLGDDVLYGYPLAAGDFLAPQAEMAGEFYSRPYGDMMRVALSMAARVRWRRALTAAACAK